MRKIALATIAVVLVGCGPRGTYSEGANEMGRAVWSGSTAQVSQLIASGEGPNERVPVSAGSPMHIAAERGDVEMLRLLLKEGGDVNLPGGNFDSGTPLVTAAGAGKLEAVKFLLDRGANPNGLGSKGQTALEAASTVEIAQELIAHGADLNAKNKYGSTPLSVQLAVSTHRAVALFLLSKGAEGGSLFYAALRGDKDLMNRLLAAGVQVNDRGGGVFAPLHAAVMSESIPSFEFLNAHKADLEAQDKAGETPLVFAASHGHSKMIGPLIKAGANVRATDQLGRTALDLVAAKGDVASVRLLIAAKANINAIDVHGWTPLFRACTNDEPEVVRVLLKAGADVHVKDGAGLTARDWAAMLQRAPILAILDSHGASK